ncbi:MAG TPA: hypothetical protein VEN78_18285 [Bradyrhizobium sp.]|nr:hypothetical protein [Bradyrhizobium sp.]
MRWPKAELQNGKVRVLLSTCHQRTVWTQGEAPRVLADHPYAGERHNKMTISLDESRILVAGVPATTASTSATV